MASSAPSRPDELRAVLEPVVTDAGLVLDGVVVTPAGRRRVVRVTVDLPDDAVGSMSLDQAAEATQVVSAALDAAGAFGEQPYLLEVGSPGVDRPLTEPRHWRRARTRLVAVEVTTDAGTRRVTGRVVEADEHGVVLLVDGERQAVAWAQLGRGAVQVEFRRPDAADDEDDEHEHDEDDEHEDDEHDEDEEDGR